MTNLRCASVSLVRALASSAAIASSTAVLSFAAILASAVTPVDVLGYEIDYDLSRFRTTDITRNTLVFQGELSPSIYDASIVNVFDRQDRSIRSIQGTGDLAFTRDVDLERRVGSYGAEVRLLGQASTTRSEETTTETDHSTSEGDFLIADRTERWNAVTVDARSMSDQSFYLGDHPFVGFEYDLDYRFRTEDTEKESAFGVYPNTDTQRSEANIRVHRHTLDTFVAGQAGWGRIYDVSYARKALFILEDLGDHGLLKRQVDPTAVEDLANLIRELEKGRVFDSREKRIHDLEGIVGFLENTGLLQNPGVEGIAIVDDNWVYARDAYRGTGTRVTVQQGYGLHYADQSRRTWTTSSETSRSDEQTWVDRRHSIRTQIDFERQQPLSQRFQLSHTAELGRNAVLDSDTIEYWGDLRMVLGYHPNSRDYGSITVGLEHLDHERNDSVVEDIIVYDRETAGSVSATWKRLLSMRTSLSLSSYYRYGDTTTIRSETSRTRTAGTGGFGIRFEHYVL
ncbi:MAG: hypothetical protein H6682_20815 [Candidatus Eisenbacteria bacterium]|nr:hypothetical protein [Candidatus Eisenbacteria bacterium]